MESHRGPRTMEKVEEETTVEGVRSGERVDET